MSFLNYHKDYQSIIKKIFMIFIDLSAQQKRIQNMIEANI